MLTPDYLEYCADDIVELYSQLDESIIRDIARRIVKAGNITDTANWQIEKIQQGGYLYDDVIAEIAKITGESESQVKTLFENAGLKSMEFDNAIYKKAGFVIPKDVMSAAAYQVLRAGADKTSGNLKNLTMTTANTSQSAYINACTLAEMQIESGAFDYQTAIRNAVREAAKRGSVISYPSGHIDRLDVAVRRAVLTGVSQTTGQVALQNAKDMGCDLMEITAHSGARPSHQVWQGQLVSLSGRTGYFSLSDIGYGEGSGFKGWNCRHDWFPYFEGISERAYTNDDLKALEDETVTYNGKSYTEYAATQVQRAMEREIRSTRRELIGLDELIKGGDNGAKAEFENLSVKLKSQEAKLKDFCNKTDRKVDKFRVQVNGFDKSVSQKAVWAEKKAVANSGKSGIIKNIELPVDVEKISSMSIETKKCILKAIDEIQIQYEVHLSEIKVLDLGVKLKRVPFQYQPYFENEILKHRLLINSEYYFNDSQEEFQARIMRNYNNGVLAAKSVEDLIAHELAHIMTFQDVSSEGGLLLRNKELMKRCYPGVSKYADCSGDGAETIAEGFVRSRNKEIIPDEVRQLITEYIERWKK